MKLANRGTRQEYLRYGLEVGPLVIHLLYTPRTALTEFRARSLLIDSRACTASHMHALAKWTDSCRAVSEALTWCSRTISRYHWHFPQNLQSGVSLSSSTMEMNEEQNANLRLTTITWGGSLAWTLAERGAIENGSHCYTMRHPSA